MNAQERLDKYMDMRKQTEKYFKENPYTLSMCVQLIGNLERDIRQCRKELGLAEWDYQ